MKLQHILSMLLFGLFVFVSCNDDDDEDMSNQENPDPNEATVEKIQEKLQDKGNLVQAIQFKNNSAQPQTLPDGSYTIPSNVLGQYPDNNYQTAAYRGAIDPKATELWYEKDNWSFYSYIVRGASDKMRPQSTKETVTDAGLRTAMNASSNKKVTWTKSKTYILDGLVFVEDGETLVIEPGTIIKGKAKDEGDPGSSLIIARGGTLTANGTSTEPIIFTFEADPLDGTTAATVSKRWGGLLILGSAGLNSTPGETSIEGIPTTEDRGLYGDLDSPDNRDNSGSLKYVSIRHGGSVIGSGNEINGLTLGGVGSGTMLSYIEIVGNEDDGIEFFGGTANVQYLISVYNKDDAVDYDEGYRGFVQFVIVHQNDAEGAADRGFECDGGTKPETAKPYATPLFVNVTAIGNPKSRAATFRDNAGGHFFNSIVHKFAKGIDIEDASGDEDTWNQFVNDRLTFQYNIISLAQDAKQEDAFAISTP